MSGLTGEYWVEKAVALYELNSLKDGISDDYYVRLAEPEVHITRMYALISNMVARSTLLKDNAVKEVTSQPQEQNKLLKANISNLEEQQRLDIENAVALEEKLTSRQNSLDNNQALINEYKEKNDALSGLVSKYSSYAEGNESLKTESADTKTQLTERAATAEKENEQLVQQLKAAEEQLVKATEQHQTELIILIEKKNIERDRAIVEVERAGQEQITATNEKIRSLYDEIAQLRANHQEKISTLKQRLEEKKDKEKNN